jgi:uncharacterized membrane protein
VFTILIALAVLVWVLLPIIGLVRSFMLQAEVRHLADRLARLESRRAPTAPEAAPRVVSPPSVVAPSPAERVAAPPTEGVTTAPAVPLITHSPQPYVPPPPVTPATVDLEAIGGRWLQHAGLIVLVLGVAFFLRYAFDRQWLSPAVRLALGGVAGMAMAAGGLQLSQRYRAYGLLTAGAGAAVLYLSVYAGLNLYFLFGPTLAFTLLVAITAAVAWVADRTDSMGLGLMAVCGGFATPFLVGGGTDQQLTLFSYVGLLVAATMYLAHRRSWPWLNAASLVCTVMTVLAWADAYYTPDRYLRTELFLTAYCAMFVAMLRRAWRRGDDANAAVAALLLLAPVGYHLWSVVTLAPHRVAFLVYLICFTAVTLMVAVREGSSLLRLIGWIAVALPLGFWIESTGAGTWTVASVAAIGGVYAAHLAVQIRTVLAGDELDARDVALVHANGVGVFAALHQLLVNSAPIEALTGLALFLAVLNAGVWTALRRAAPIRALHWVGVAATLVAIAVWVQLGGPFAVAAWASEGVALFWIASKADRPWLRAGAGTLIGLAVLRWLQPDIQATTTSFVVLANARALTGLAIVAALYLGARVAHRAPPSPRDTGAAARERERAALLIGASVVTLAVLSTEIVSFWTLRGTAADSVAREMMLSASWVMYAAVVVLVGMRTRYAPIRYFAMALFGVSLLKIFLIDLARVGGIYRVIGFLVVGVILVLVSFAYQRANVGAEPKT